MTLKKYQNPEGGLNEKGRAAARAEGHHLKAPTKDSDNPRHKSFCERMTGMKRKMTGAAAAADPDRLRRRQLFHQGVSWE